MNTGNVSSYISSRGDTHPHLWLGFGPLWMVYIMFLIASIRFNSGYTTSVDCVLMVLSTNTGKQPPLLNHPAQSEASRMGEAEPAQMCHGKYFVLKSRQQ